MLHYSVQYKGQIVAIFSRVSEAADLAKGIAIEEGENSHLLIDRWDGLNHNTVAHIYGYNEIKKAERMKSDAITLSGEYYDDKAF